VCPSDSFCLCGAVTLGDGSVDDAWITARQADHSRVMKAMGRARQGPRLPLPFVLDRDPRVITVRRRVIIRVGIVVIVIAALGLGIAIGVAVGSKSPSTAKSIPVVASTTIAHSSTTTSPQTTMTLVPSPAVLSCGPGSTPLVRPKRLIVGCATRNALVTDITWSSWRAATGGQGTGTLIVGFARSPAIVVVFNDVNGIFQDVSITPSKSVSTTSTTTLATTPTTGVPSPIAASQPGSAWGSEG
jgi:hypothetical protein